MNTIIFNDFCKNKKCLEYIEWKCEWLYISCKLVGQSYDAAEYPKDCLFLYDIKKFQLTTLTNPPTKNKVNHENRLH